jgi:hypothetical protein
VLQLSTTPLRRIEGVEVQHHTLTSALDGGQWSASRPDRFTPETESRVPIGQAAERDPERCGRSGEEKNSQILAGIRTPIMTP